MARTPKNAAPLPPQGMRVYWLIDDKIDSPRLGDVPVQKDGEWRFVVMNEKQAEYWIDQGAISLEQEPKGKRAAVVQQQIMGEGEEVISERKKKTR